MLQDYSRRARAEQVLNLRRKHLNALVLGMLYPRFDEVVAQGKAHPVGLRGLGDWLSRQEGYKRRLCQWVKVVWSRSLGLTTDIELDPRPQRARPNEAAPRRPADELAPLEIAMYLETDNEAEPGGQRGRSDQEARQQSAEEQARPREAAARQQARARRLRHEQQRQAARPVKPVEAFRDSLRDGGQGPAMVVLPTGRFRMGDLDGSGNSNERPVRTVTISHRIAMGKYTITFEEYDQFVASTDAERPADEGWGRGSRPVINVNWLEAKAYAAWLSEQTGKRYRLPSEAEWEYAARAGTETAYSWGDEIGVNRANGHDSGSEWSHQRTSPVGSFAPNDFGL